MKILLSDLALRALLTDIARVMGSRPFECVSFEDAVASGRRDFDVAFVSRDVTGLSTKHELAPSLKACYKVLEESPFTLGSHSFCWRGSRCLRSPESKGCADRYIVRRQC